MLIDRIAQTYRLAKVGLQSASLKPNKPYTVADLIEKQAAAAPDRAFCLFEDRRVTYREYNAGANRVAHWALDAGLGHGDVVALLMLNKPEYLQIWAGLAKIGVTTALINTNLTDRSLRHAILAAKARHLVVGNDSLENYLSMGDDVPGGLHVYVSSEDRAAERLPGFPAGAHDFERALGGQPTANPDASARAKAKTGDELFYIYTSGTTGLPKAAKFSHLRFMTSGALSEISGFGRNDTMYIALPLYHSAGGAMAVASVLRTGGTIALRRRFSASQFWSDIQKYDATAFQYIGEFCRYLLNAHAEGADVSHRLKFAVGNGLRPDIWEEFQTRFRIPKIVEFYGATEGNVALMNLDGKVGSIGRLPPRFLVDARLIQYDVPSDTHPRGEDGLCIECKPDEVGELIGALPTSADDTKGRFEGYTSKDATEKKILHGVFAEGDAWFRTGDLLRCDAEGYFYFVDRIGDTFRWKGENVSTQDVAESLAGLEGVDMVNVYGVEVQGQDGRAGMAAMIVQRPDQFDGSALFEHVGRTLPPYAAPLFVRVQVDAEVTGTFKLRKVDLQKQGFDPSAQSDPLYFRDDSKQAYVPLTPELYSDIQGGRVRV